MALIANKNFTDYIGNRWAGSQPRTGKISRGWPSRRWQDDIAKKEGTTWNMKALDGRQRKALVEGYIQQWMDKA